MLSVCSSEFVLNDSVDTKNSSSSIDMELLSVSFSVSFKPELSCYCRAH